MPQPRAVVRPVSHARRRAQLLIVLGLSLGQSAVYSVVQLIDKATQAPLSQGTSTLNRSLNAREYFDLTYQLLDIVFALVPVALALYFVWDAVARTSGGPVEWTAPFRRLGLDLARPGRDWLWGVGLFLAIGIPSLGLYWAGRALGITTAIIPSGLDQHWWTVPVLIVSAMRHAVLEEVIVVAFMLGWLRRLGWAVPAAVAASALLRGSYHLYQGIGPFVGNAVMGLVFALVYRKYGRVMPLVIAHALLDITAFVGFSLVGRTIGLG
ncbi:CPBP family intramembrane glutamic endopeptidase [Sinomonas sp. ASV486]|uniref:CPBP family intramembrane glutamic endopeptidase n=1 Tax=Sinomonas sp. ASV486 TaxID=3051170 RepID=UPI0027DD0B15|nr:CPBP family intramembrane glutamic endopeptidase [Sinomonas sp. ASV486]MDQ4490413.1 CPBP family intramembrane glutamic endopeptidase [Sinomonas sp. ASV486]